MKLQNLFEVEVEDKSPLSKRRFKFVSSENNAANGVFAGLVYTGSLFTTPNIKQIKIGETFNGSIDPTKIQATIFGLPAQGIFKRVANNTKVDIAKEFDNPATFSKIAHDSKNVLAHF